MKKLEPAINPQIGDSVTSLIYGKGEVKQIDTFPTSYSIHVDFEFTENVVFTKDGREYKQDPPTLFKGHFDITNLFTTDEKVD